MSDKNKNRIRTKMLNTCRDLSNYIEMKDQVDKKLINQSWEKIEKQLFQPQRSLRHRILVASAVAACTFATLSISLYFFYSHSNDTRTLSADLLNNSLVMPSDSIQDIVLFTSGNQIKLNQEEASIRYQTDGSLEVDNVPIEKKKTDTQKTPALNHIIVPKGKRVNLTLSDGTQIFVNAGSHLIYPERFEKEKREIVVEGEVFLDVAKDPKRPFTVKVKGFDVKVLGTSFNICAYNEDKEASVVLVEGHVEVKTNKNEIVQLTPNRMVNITAEGTESREVNVLEYICWKDNMMLLSGHKADDIFNKLARFYGCTISFDSAAGNLILQGKLDLNENIRDVMDMICISLSLQYVIDENNNISICSTY